MSFNLLCPVLNVEIAGFEPVTACSAAIDNQKDPDICWHVAVVAQC
jgi:hypothetical protein